MKININSFRKLNIIVFLIALVNMQLLFCIDLSPMTKKHQTPVTPSSDQECQELKYFDLKLNVVGNKYLKKIHKIVNLIFKQNNVTKKDEIEYSLFSKVFKEGKYGKIAVELSKSEDYIHSYWDYFVHENDKTMTQSDFEKFMGLYYLEGELLVTEQHPTLTEFFPNEHNYYKRKGSKPTLAFWDLVEERLKKVFEGFSWKLSKNIVTKTEMFSIYMTTRTGKCSVTNGDGCKTLNELFSYLMGFFNFSNGKRKSLTQNEAKFAYSTLVFDDVHDPGCKQTKFDEKNIEKLVKKLNFP